MKVSKGVLWVVGIILVVYAIVVLVNPVQMIGGTGVQLPTPNAVADGRATYGGLILGLGAFFVFSALNSARVRGGLWAEVFTLGGFAVGRTLAVLIDSSAATGADPRSHRIRDSVDAPRRDRIMASSASGIGGCSIAIRRRH